jgi:hypothetical protein
VVAWNNDPASCPARRRGPFEHLSDPILAIECADDVSGGTFCLQGQSRGRMCLDYTSRQSGGSAHRGP